MDGTPKTEHALTALMTLLQADIEACNKVIMARVDSPVALIPQVLAKLIAAGGQQLRPLLVMASARLCGYDPTGGRHVVLAACVEFIHTASSLHDDVVDESALRRGQASGNAVLGNQASVLVADFIFARAYQLMVTDGAVPVIAILSGAIATIAEGELLQLKTQNDISTTEAQYLAVIHGKTAALFAAAARLGAVAAGRPASEEQALDAYGRNLGIAFQLVDDALDYSTNKAVLGKTVGDDFREGKISLPVLVAIARADSTERAFWQRTLEDGEQGEGDFAKAKRLITRYGALEETFSRARAYGAAALAALEPFADSAEKRAMQAMVEHCVECRR
ncbi:MAG: polyprenyl synthetase family protein [Roseococcus sp.]